MRCIPRLFLSAFMAFPMAVGLQCSGEPTEVPPIVANVERLAPPTIYFPNVERWRFGAADMENLAFYPVPRDLVSRASYLRAVEAARPESIADQSNRSLYGPVDFLPVLVKYVQTGDSRWSDAIARMFNQLQGAMQDTVAAHRWIWQFESPFVYVPFYRHYLIQGGAMREDEPWFREMWLYYCRNLHVWDSEPTEWRGGCHRALGEAMYKGLAAQWYPGIPEAAHWREYATQVFADFWRAKDLPQNDTGYMMSPLNILACAGTVWTGDDRVFTDPGMRRIWDRLTDEVTPDGAINPYGPNGGWNTTADYRIFLLEYAAAKTRDGRYRYAAQKLFNYLRYQTRSGDGYDVAPGMTALAWLVADDSVAPVQPSAGSLWNERTEAARRPVKDKAVVEHYLGHPDPDPNKGWICCGWTMTDKVWPNKLILRSGWAPGDLFALIELHPTSFPANPGGIMGLNRFGAPFTQICTSKGHSVENRAEIADLSGAARRRFIEDPNRYGENWEPDLGRTPDIRSEVTWFEDTSEATYARVRVENPDALPVTYEREFVFAKNRFLATREVVTFEEGFKARVAPLWNTQNVGPQIGPNWANTFISTPVGDNGQVSMKTPPVDLLVWFAPRADCRLQVIDRLLDDPRAGACPARVQYLWEGDAQAGQKLVFTQLYYPHAPYRARPTTNNPIPNLKAAYADERQATAHASGIEVVRDDAEASILRLELEPGHTEWVAFNPGKASLQLGTTNTDNSYIYVGRERQP